MPLARQIRDEGRIAPADPEAVQQALIQILASNEFRASPRLSAFLTFCVGRSLEGRADTLKAYTIATQVFMRPDHFDPQADPIVRVEATRLRRAMQRYYGQEGANDPLHLLMERGQYGVSFIPRPQAPPSHLQTMPQLSISLLEKLAAIAEGRKESDDLPREAPAAGEAQGIPAEERSSEDKPVKDLALPRHFSKELPVQEIPFKEQTVTDLPAAEGVGAAQPSVQEPARQGLFGFSLAALPVDLKLVLLGLSVLAMIFMVAWYNVPPPIVTQKPDKALAAKAGLTARAFQPARLVVVAESTASDIGAWVEDLRDALAHFDAIIVLDASVQGDKRGSVPDFQLGVRRTAKGSLMLRLAMVGGGDIIWSREVPFAPDQPLAVGALAPWLTELAAWDGLINRRHWGATQFERSTTNEALPCQHQAMRALLAGQLDLIHMAQACFDKDLASGLAWSKPQWRLRLDLMAMTLGDQAVDAAAVWAEAQRHVRQAPLSASAYGLAGQVLMVMGRTIEARDMLAKARVLNPYDLGFERAQTRP